MDNELTAEDDKQIMERVPLEEQGQFLFSKKEKWDEYKKASPFYVQPSSTLSAIYNNPMFNRLAIRNQQAISEAENSFSYSNNVNPYDKLFGVSYNRAVLQRERNRLFAEYEAEEDGSKRDWDLLRIQNIEQRLKTTGTDETFSDKVTSVIASILDSTVQNLGYIVAGAAIGVTGGTAAPILGTAVLVTGGYRLTKEDTKNAAIYEQYAEAEGNVKEDIYEKAERIGTVTGILEGAGDALGISALAATQLTKSLIKSTAAHFAKDITKKTAEKIAKQSFKKAAIEFGKETLKGAVAEGLTEAAQDIVEYKGYETDSTGELLTASVGEVADIFEKAATGVSLDERQKQVLETFTTTVIGSAIFGAPVGAASNGINMVSERVAQNRTNRSDKKMFEAKSKIDAPKEMMDFVSSTVAQNGKVPEKRYISTEELLKVVDEQLLRDDLPETDKAYFNELKSRVEKSKTLGIFEMDATEHNIHFVDPRNKELFQRTLGAFYVSPSQIEENFSSEQLTMQSVKELFPKALEQDSAFLDAYNAMKESKSFKQEDLLANALQYNALLSMAAEAQGLSYKQMKDQFGVSFDLSKINAKEKGDIAGSLKENSGKLILSLTNQANPTTFAHETFHLFDRIIGQLIDNGYATPKLKKRIENMYKAAEYKKGNLTDTKERLAEAWTEYLATGKSPVKGYEGMFNTFRMMFGTLYRLFVRRGALNKAVRKQFDRIFMSQTQAELAVRAANIGAIERPEGYSDEFYQKYVDAYNRTVIQTADKTTKAINELTDIRNTEEYKNKYAEFYKNFMAEKEKDPFYQGQNLIIADKNLKIKKSDLDYFDSVNKKMVSGRKNALDIYTVASVLTQKFNHFFEAADVAEMATSMTAEEKSTQETETAMQAYLRETKPELFAEMEAVNDVSEINAVDAVLCEYVFLKGLPERSFGEIKTMFDKAVKEQMDLVSIKDLAKPDKYKEMLIGNIAKQKSLKKGDKKLADLKFQQAVRMELFKKAKEAVNKLTKFQNNFQKYKNEQNKGDVKKIDSKSFDLIRSILYDAGFTQKLPRQNIQTSEKLSNWIFTRNSLESLNGAFDSFEPLFSLMIEANKKGYLSLPSTDFYQFDALLRGIEDSSKFLTKTEEEAKKQEIETDVNEFIERLDFVGLKTKNKSNMFQRAYIQGIIAPRLLKTLVPARLYEKYFIPLEQGIFKASVYKNEKIKAFDAILKKEYPVLDKMLNFDIKTISGNRTISLTREQALVLMLNSGSKHNTACSIETIINNPLFGIKQTDREIQLSEANQVYKQILEQSPVEFQEYAKAIFKELALSNNKEYMNSKGMYSLSEALYETNGLLMKEADTEQFKFEGCTLEGGYYPASRKKTIEINEEYRQDFNDVFGVVQASNTKDRIAPHDLSLSLQPLKSWITATGNQINIAPSYSKYVKFINNEKLKTRLGDFWFDKIKNWTEGLQKQESVNEIIRALDSHSTIYVMGASVTKALKQIAGLFPAMVEVSPSEIISSLGSFITNPKKSFNAVEYAKTLSPYMKNRYDNPTMSIFGGYENMLGAKKSLAEGYRKYSEYSMIMLTYADAMVNTVTWEAAYNKALNEGKSENIASGLADHAVMLSQGDGSVFTRPELLKGNLRILSKFATYFFSLNSSVFSDIVCFKDPAARAHLAGTLFSALIASALFESLIEQISASIFDDDDDKDFWERYKENYASTAGAMALPAFWIGSSITRATTTGKYYSSNLSTFLPLDNFVRFVARLSNGNEVDFNELFALGLGLITPKSIEKMIKD